MKLASLRTGGPDGTLIVVSRDLCRAIETPQIVRTLQAALDRWSDLESELQEVYTALNAGAIDGFSLDPEQLAAPLPRAYQWLDASAYVSHVELVRKARGAPMPPSLWTDPIMYQGGSDSFLACRDPIMVVDEDAWEADFEAEIAVIVDHVPMAASRSQAADSIRLLVLVNDISLRGLIPQELTKGFGFVHGKPSSAFSPVAVTPDEFAEAWDGAKLNLPLIVHHNQELFGHPNAGKDMTFDFPTLIVHAAKTRRLTPGTIIGAGTVSNRDPATGSCCIVERRMREVLERGEASTPFLRSGDQVRIDMLSPDGASILGAIEQRVDLVQ